MTGWHLSPISLFYYRLLHHIVRIIPGGKESLLRRLNKLQHNGSQPVCVEVPADNDISVHGNPYLANSLPFVFLIGRVSVHGDAGEGIRVLLTQLLSALEEVSTKSYQVIHSNTPIFIIGPAGCQSK